VRRIARVWIAATAFIYVTATVLFAAEWQTPSGKITIKLTTMAEHSGPIQRLAIGNDPLPLLGHSGIRRENHGFAWLATTTPRWVRDRYLVFQDREGLCIVDSARRLVLINQVFAGFAKSPRADKWAAIRFRPTSRQQETLSDTHRDTLWFIDPDLLSQRSELSSDDKPFAHIAATQLDHIAVAPPVWTEDGLGVVVPIYSGEAIECVLIDADSQKERKRIQLNSLNISRAEALTPWFSKEVEASVAAAIQSSGLLSTSTSP
jgi:hypothetical protein